MRILGPAGEGVRSGDQKGALGRRNTVADKRGRVPQTLVMWTLGLGSAMEQRLRSGLGAGKDAVSPLSPLPQ